MKKPSVFAYIVNEYTFGEINVLEFGRIRSTRPPHEYSDGWSTLHFAEHPRVRKVYSVDTNPHTIARTKQVVPKGYHEKIAFAEQVEELELEEASIDLLLLDADGGNDHKLQFQLYQKAKPFLKQQSLVLVDDVLGTRDVKGKYVVPALNQDGYEIVEVPPMVLGVRRREGE